MKTFCLPKYILIIVLCSVLFQARAALYTVGNGTTQTTSTNQTPFSNAVSDARRQYIIQASELTSQGLHFSYISSLAFNVGTTFNTSTLNGFTIKIKHTPAATCSGTFDTTGFTTVFSGNVSIIAQGWKTFPFISNFFWDGTSNLMVEVCYNNTAPSGTSTSVIATANLNQYCQVATGTTTAVGCNLGPSATTVNTRPNMQLNILPVNCNGAPQPGTINGPSNYSVVLDPSFTLTLTNYQVAEGISTMV